MSHPTLRSLVGGLGRDLQPVSGFTATDAAVSAVHVSELPDPTGFLSGGELLLTTGLALPKSVAGCETYVARLVRSGVAGLGFGVGPVHDTVPAVLVRACRGAGLPLLVVPAQTPFLAISRAYWHAIAREGEQVLLDQLAYQRALVDAATSEDPTGAVLRTLATAADGWSAVLAPDGRVERAHPQTARERAQPLADDIAQMASGPRTASLISGERHVVLLPLTAEGRAFGFLAVGADHRISPGERRTVVTAASLLGLVESRAAATRRSSASARTGVAALLDLGMVDAAARLGAVVGAPPVPAHVRVLALRSVAVEAAVGLVEQWCEQAHGAVADGERAWFAVPADWRAAAGLPRSLLALDPSVRASLSEPVRVTDLGGVRLRELDALDALDAGSVALDPVVPVSRAGVRAGLAGLLTADRPALVGAARAYLRHRGHWEAAARDLGVHRNTLRYRVDRVREITGLDLDDPDVAAHLWLALRDHTPD
ncbi:PucR family transcriptional regulator [Streptomyces phaeolivaceus]|uniref:PucR family transcriptional regulator n=1 Tax=Streptomyces phaeolivaceus TaxID=2653200 RepID=A0A5P8KF64_9ACTN|nr:PucR family transcriptional regulator [Streptomyces phaeolivaceus]QFR01657.1 PucR family transcriptional regulator [Streptomyces phaeolivaceus]